MALLPFNLFFENNRDYGVGTIKFDLILTENHNFTNEVTEHTIENGSVISDHIKNNLERGSLVGMVTNFSVNTFGSISNRAQDAYDALKRLWKERTTITITTVMEVYEDVVLTDVSVDRSEETGEAIELNISFKKINTVQLKETAVDLSVNIPNMNNNLNRQSAPKAELGRQTGVTQ